jgi:hypothetical protein
MQSKPLNWTFRARNPLRWSFSATACECGDRLRLYQLDALLLFQFFGVLGHQKVLISGPGMEGRVWPTAKAYFSYFEVASQAEVRDASCRHLSFCVVLLPPQGCLFLKTVMLCEVMGATSLWELHVAPTRLPAPDFAEVTSSASLRCLVCPPQNGSALSERLWLTADWLFMFPPRLNCKSHVDGCSLLPWSSSMSTLDCKDFHCHCVRLSSFTKKPQEDSNSRANRHFEQSAHLLVSVHPNSCGTVPGKGSVLQTQHAVG